MPKQHHPKSNIKHRSSKQNKYQPTYAIRYSFKSDSEGKFGFHGSLINLLQLGSKLAQGTSGTWAQTHSLRATLPVRTEPLNLPWSRALGSFSEKNARGSLGLDGWLLEGNGGHFLKKKTAGGSLGLDGWFSKNNNHF